MDPKEELEEQCTEQECPKLKNLLDECTLRVEKNPEMGETCVQELLDLARCVDKCVNVIYCLGSQAIVFEA